MDDRDRVVHRPSWVPWAVSSLVLLAVAFLAFAFGTRQAVVIGADDRIVHSWNWGFPGVGFFLMLWIFFACFRRWSWWGCGYPPYYRRWRNRRFYGDPYDDEREWEEWHRREHERMKRASGASEPAERSGEYGAPRATP